MTRILVVEDRPIDREFLVALLGHAGYEALAASDGLEALEIAWAAGASLIIADILMPTMDGFEFVRRLRANPATAQVPVVFYSVTYHHREARALAQAAGVAHVLFKPADPDVILDTVSAILAQPEPKAAEGERAYVRLLAARLADRAARLDAINLDLGALVQLSAELPLEEGATTALGTFCAAARKLVGARIAGVGIIHADGQRLKRFVICGVDAQTVARIRPPLARDGVFGRLLTELTPIRTGELPTHLQATSFSPHHPHVHAFLAVPIASSQRVHGWLYFCDKSDTPDAQEFDEEDERVALVLAAQAALAYERASITAAAPPTQARGETAPD
jgi:CheY-like chemotaxis protein